MQKVIIIGATSGIGKELAQLYSRKECVVGIVGRREELLKELYSQNREKYFYEVADITDRPRTINALNSLLEKMQGLDLLILSAGTGELNPQLHYSLEEPAMKTNVLGFTSIVNWGYKIFEQQRSGHLVTISSVAGIRGGSIAPSYNASKAYQINYIEGLRQKNNKLRLPIYITDIRPGFIDTAMAKGEGLFWITPVNKAADQIYKAIIRKRKIAYISRRWKYIAYLLKGLPSSIYTKI